jgi:hypothetical protein
MNPQNRQITAWLNEMQEERSELEKGLSDNRRTEEELRVQLKNSQKPKYQWNHPPLRPALYQPTEPINAEPVALTSGHFYPQNDPFSPPTIGTIVDYADDYTDAALWTTFAPPSQLVGSAEFTERNSFIPPTQNTL